MKNIQIGDNLEITLLGETMRILPVVDILPAGTRPEQGKIDMYYGTNRPHIPMEIGIDRFVLKTKEGYCILPKTASMTLYVKHHSKSGPKLNRFQILKLN